MKRNYMIAGAGAILVAVALIGGTLAANNAQTSQAAHAQISVNDLDGGINADSQNPVYVKGSGVYATPGGDYEIRRFAVNAGGDLDYDAFFKAVIYKSWTDGAGEYIDIAASEDVKEDRPYILVDGEKAFLDELEMNDVLNGWLVGYVDDEEIELFYTKRVPVGEASTDFINGVAFTEHMDNAFAQASYQLDFEVTAVQADDDAEAIASTLGVYPAMDENGNIVSVSEEKPE